MNSARFEAITSRYRSLRIAVVGDFCLDRYLEIDPAREEISIETGLPVHNVVSVRSQPGGAGTIAANLSALGVGAIRAVGFHGCDGEGYELRRALQALPGMDVGGFLETPDRRTFTYTKPLVTEAGRSPRELSRLDLKNWTPTPEGDQAALAETVREIAGEVDALLLLDQVDLPETGVATRLVQQAVHDAQRRHPGLVVLADCRRGLGGYPPMGFKMNAVELCAMLGEPAPASIERACECARELARRNAQPVFVSLAERGIVGAAADGTVEHAPAFPVRGEIDVVGAGDSVTANLAAARAAGAGIREALELAMAAASTVIHQLGTTGTASIEDLRKLAVTVKD